MIELLAFIWTLIAVLCSFLILVVMVCLIIMVLMKMISFFKTPE